MNWELEPNNEEDYLIAEAAYQTIIDLMLKQSNEFYRNAIESTQCDFEEQEYLKDLRTAQLLELENLIENIKKESKVFNKKFNLKDKD